MAQIKKDLTMALKLAVVEAIEEEYWGSVDLEEEKPVMLPRISESVKIQKKSEEQKVEVVSLDSKKNWMVKFIYPIAIIIAATILAFIANGLTTKAIAEISTVEQKLSGEISRVEQKVDDFIIREQDHFSILLEEVRILRTE